MQHKPKYVTTCVSVRNDFNLFFSSLSNFSMYLKCKHKFQSRSKCLISELPCWRCYTYMEGKEEMFKIRIRFTMILILQVTGFPMFSLTMKEQKRSGRQNSGEVSSPSEL